MMLQPSKEELELYDKLKSCKNEHERQIILLQLKELAIKEEKKLKESPFAH